MKQTVKTSRAAGQLEKMFRELNKHYYNGELPEPIISLKKTPCNHRGRPDPPSAVSARWYAVQALDAVTDQCLSISGAGEEVTTTNLKGQNLKNKFQIQFQERGFNYGKIS